MRYFRSIPKQGSNVYIGIELPDGKRITWCYLRKGWGHPFEWNSDGREDFEYLEPLNFFTLMEQHCYMKQKELENKETVS